MVLQKFKISSVVSVQSVRDQLPGVIDVELGNYIIDVLDGWITLKTVQPLF